MVFNNMTRWVVFSVSSHEGFFLLLLFFSSIKKWFSYQHNHGFTKYFHIQMNRITITIYHARSVGGDKVPEDNNVSMGMSLLFHGVSN